MDSNASDPGLPAAQNTRREVLQGLGGALLFVLTARGNPAQIYAAARARRDLFLKLNELEGKTLEALGDTLLPGAAHAGSVANGYGQTHDVINLFFVRVLASFPPPERSNLRSP